MDSQNYWGGEERRKPQKEAGVKVKATGASADEARETVVKYLRDAVPLGEHTTPHAEFITVRLDVVQAAADAIEAFDDDKEWIEKGLAEWRGMALENAKHAEAARATARIAINYLQSVLNKPRTHAQQQDADTAARHWLLSIGAEPQ